MPESVPPRPRRRPPDEPVPVAAPQAIPVATPIERRMLELVEELHHVTGQLGLPPQALRIEPRDLNGALETFQVSRALSVVELTDRFLADLDIAVLGPSPQPLAAAVTPPDPEAFVVTGLARPGTTVMLTGPPGAGKSWASRQLAFTAGSGLRLFLDRYEVTRRLNVLIVDEDNGEREEWRREETLLAFLEQPRTNLDTVWRTSLAGVQLDKPEWQAWLRFQIHALSLDLVVLDPISEMYGGKELRDDPAFRAVLTFLKRLKVDYPELVTLLVHHPRKPPSRMANAQLSIEDVRGQWGQTPDVIALMSPLADRRVAWEVHKRVPHSKLFLEATEAGPLRLVGDEQTMKSKAMVNDGAVIDAIRGGLETFGAIQEGLGMPKATVSVVLKRLVGAGVIQKDGRIYTVDEGPD